MIEQLKQEIENTGDEERARLSARYFKTGPGEYGEGDMFIGITVPQLRAICKRYAALSLHEISQLLTDNIHEFRSAALIVLVLQFEKASSEQRKEIVEFYLAHTNHVNNWDLVDGSAPYILGEYLADKEKALLSTLAQSKNLWERRIGIVATYAFIKRGELEETLLIAELLLKDTHDLIHKAVGWMLREVGKKDQSVLEEFLKRNACRMPRTMLRYAIERFRPEKRKLYLCLRTEVV
ncbi:DNA alkylation repair protein [Candidatus Woesearchaeota archaeon]|nr:DNA alkylation repair protein [Candidatus Woesearchaeota archaeon]